MLTKAHSRQALNAKRAGDNVKLSERAMQILHPQSPQEKAAAIRASAREPALFAELAERFPGAMPNEELLRNYLLRNGFAPAAVSSVILAYRETSELEDQESGPYDSAPSPSPGEPRPPMQSPSYPGTPGPQTSQNSAVLQGNEQVLLMYQFAGGGPPLRLTVANNVDIFEALDMAETQIEIKRKELSRIAKRAEATARIEKDKDDGEENA